MISERKFHHGGPGIANGVVVSAAIMVGQAGKEGGVSTVFFVRLKKKQVVTSRPILGDIFLFKHTQ